MLGVITFCRVYDTVVHGAFDQLTIIRKIKGVVN